MSGHPEAALRHLAELTGVGESRVSTRLGKLSRLGLVEGPQCCPSKSWALTPQQIRVLMMLSQGLLNKQIAYELGVSEATVKAHVSAIFQKLGVESRTQAVILATKIEAAQELLIAS